MLPVFHLELMAILKTAVPLRTPFLKAVHHIHGLSVCLWTDNCHCQDSFWWRGRLGQSSTAGWEYSCFQSWSSTLCLLLPPPPLHWETSKRIRTQNIPGCTRQGTQQNHHTLKNSFSLTTGRAVNVHGEGALNLVLLKLTATLCLHSTDSSDLCFHRTNLHRRHFRPVCVALAPLPDVLILWSP